MKMDPSGNGKTYRGGCFSLLKTPSTLTSFIFSLELRLTAVPFHRLAELFLSPSFFRWLEILVIFVRRFVVLNCQAADYNWIDVTNE